MAAAKRGSTISCMDHTDVGQEATQELVLALRAGLEAGEPLANAVLDAAVVAELEMQAVEVAARAPVAPVQRVRAAQQDRAGDGLAADACKLDHQVSGHDPRELARRRPD